MHKAVMARAVAASVVEGVRKMKRPVSDIAFTPAVKAAQQQRGSREFVAVSLHPPRASSRGA